MRDFFSQYWNDFGLIVFLMPLMTNKILTEIEGKSLISFTINPQLLCELA